MNDIIHRFIEDLATDADMKRMGEVARLGKESELYQLIQGIVDRYAKSQSKVHSVNFKDEEKIHSFLTQVGMRMILNELDRMIDAEKDIIEKQNKPPAQEEQVDNLAIGYGEGIETANSSTMV